MGRCAEDLIRTYGQPQRGELSGSERVNVKEGKGQRLKAKIGISEGEGEVF